VPPPPNTASFAVVAPGWDTQALTQIEKQLARFVGPIARVLVRNASRETSDLVSLLQSVATKIRSAPDREDFLRITGAGVALSAEMRRSNSDTEFPGGATVGGVPLTPEYIERASQLLAIHLGPIAKVLAKRAAQSGASQEQFVATLATHLGDDRERARFLKALA
jgi:serine/threonine-protein kinase